MQVLATHKDPPDVIVFDSLTLREQQTRLALTSRLLRAWDVLPVQGAFIMALGLFMRQATEKSSSGQSISLFDRLMGFAEALRALIDFLGIALKGDAKSLQRDVLDGQLSATMFKQMSGLQALIDGKVISEPDATALLLYAAPNQGINYSQRQVVELLLSIARMEPPLAAAQSFESNYAAVRETVTAIRLMELCCGYLDSGPKQTSTETLSREQTSLAQRVATLREIAGVMASIRLAALHVMTSHVWHWLRHPYITSIASADDAIQMKLAAEEVTGRAIGDYGIPTWPEWDSANHFDYRLVTPWLSKGIRVPTQNLAEIPIDDGDALMADMSFEVAIDRSALGRYTDLSKRCSTDLVQARADLEFTVDGQVNAFQAHYIPAPVDLNWFTGGWATLPSVSTTIPVVADALPRPRLLPNTSVLRFGANPPSVHSLHSSAQIEKYVERALPKYYPTIITGEPIKPHLISLPVPCPWIDPWDRGTPPFAKNALGLQDLLQRGSDGLQRLIESLGTNLEGPGLQQIAEALRLIGMVVICEGDWAAPPSSAEKPSEKSPTKPKTASNVLAKWKVVYTYMRLWYKADAAIASTMLSPESEWIRLALVDAEWEGRRANVSVVLAPFAHIPDSAVATRMPMFIRMMDKYHDRIHGRPILRWEASNLGERLSVEPALPIAGWKFPTVQVADITLTRVLPVCSFEPVYVRSQGENAQATRPLWAARYNAVVSYTSPTPEAYVGSSFELPPRFLVVR